MTIKTSNKIVLKKKGSSKSSFYLPSELPKRLEDALRYSLVIKGVEPTIDPSSTENK